MKPFWENRGERKELSDAASSIDESREPDSEVTFESLDGDLIEWIHMKRD
jgi:hypothetical protein